MDFQDDEMDFWSLDRLVAEISDGNYVHDLFAIVPTIASWEATCHVAASKSGEVGQAFAPVYLIAISFVNLSGSKR